MTTASGPTVPPLEKRLLLGAVAVGLLHAVDDAVLNRQTGVSTDQHLTALAAATVAAAASAVRCWSVETPV